MPTVLRNWKIWEARLQKLRWIRREDRMSEFPRPQTMPLIRKRVVPQSSPQRTKPASSWWSRNYNLLDKRINPAEAAPPAGSKPLTEILRPIEARSDFAYFEEVELEDGK
jgi:hypothetical protein